jgi:DNA-binding XRE family transcriptional regulator
MQKWQAMNIGPKIRKLRELFGYKQDFVAKWIKLHQSTYCRMEKFKLKEKMKGDTLEKLADLYKIEPDDILNIDEKFFVNIHEQNNQTGGVIINKYPDEFFAALESSRKALEATVEAQALTLKVLEAKIKALEEENMALKALSNKSGH